MADTINETILTPLGGTGYPVRDWLTSYPLMLVALDPYSDESSWILDTALRLLTHFDPADIRTGWLVAADADGCRSFLGPLADQHLTFADPDRTAVSAFAVDRTPSLVVAYPDGSVRHCDGWDPDSWRSITQHLAGCGKSGLLAGFGLPGCDRLASSGSNSSWGSDPGDPGWPFRPVSGPKQSFTGGPDRPRRVFTQPAASRAQILIRL